MKSCTHYFKQAVYRDGVKYQRTVGLNEEYDWRLILDLSEDPSWQFVTLNRPLFRPVPPEPKRKGLFSGKRIVKYRCPVCRGRLHEVEERYPDPARPASLAPLPPHPSPVELWHDDEARCPFCRTRLGVNRGGFPALPSPERHGLLKKR